MKRLHAAFLISLTYTACRGADSGLPADYRGLRVPEAQLRSDEARSHGRALYERHCALCHGVHADGQGARREGLS